MAKAILATISETAEMVSKDPMNWARTETLVKTAVKKIQSCGVCKYSALHMLTTGLDDIYAFAILERMRQQA